RAAGEELTFDLLCLTICCPLPSLDTAGEHEEGAGAAPWRRARSEDLAEPSKPGTRLRSVAGLGFLHEHPVFPRCPVHGGPARRRLDTDGFDAAVVAVGGGQP